MNSQIIIAVDAMGGDNSPNKVIEGVSIHSKTSNDVHYKIFGDTNLTIVAMAVKVRISKIQVNMPKGTLSSLFE